MVSSGKCGFTTLKASPRLYQGFALIEKIKSKCANLKFLKDIWIDLSKNNPYSYFLITVMAGVNQLERDLIKISTALDV